MLKPSECYKGYDWIKVKRAKAEEACVAAMHAPQRLVVSEEHHIEETTFLIEEIRKLASELSVVPELLISKAECKMDLKQCEVEIAQLKAKLTKARSQDEARQRAINRQARWDSDYVGYQEDDHDR